MHPSSSLRFALTRKVKANQKSTQYEYLIKCLERLVLQISGVTPLWCLVCWHTFTFTLSRSHFYFHTLTLSRYRESHRCDASFAGSRVWPPTWLRPWWRQSWVRIISNADVFEWCIDMIPVNRNKKYSVYKDLPKVPCPRGKSLMSPIVGLLIVRWSLFLIYVFLCWSSVSVPK